MDLWFITNHQLLGRERQAISALQRNAEWLVGAEWGIYEGKLCANVVIRAHRHDYELRLIYPNLFPEVPPTVLPVNAAARWSAEHQYGRVGPLCLEWGPDNWHPEVTGAQVLESAYKLLDIENPLGEQTAPDEAAVARVAESRHALNPGQELRNEFARFYVGEQTLQHLNGLPDDACGILRFSTHSRSKSYLAVIHETQVGDDIWSDSSTPAFLRGKDDRDLKTGAFFKTDSPSEMVKAVNTSGDLVNVLRAAGYENRISVDGNTIKFDGGETSPFGFLILDRDHNPHLIYPFDDGGTLTFARIQSNSSEENKRIPDNLRELSGKSIGIVGLGSAGSKIALSLARMGVRRFYLVDYDVFLPENAERNALDWSNLGDHKVDGTFDALRRLGVDFDVEVSRTDITGQESPAVVSAVLDRLGNCDLLIDATAAPRVFNLMAATAAIHEKPLVWLEIYAGGIGGMIARSRPDFDPAPQTMRSAYLEFCEHNPAPENLRGDAARNYESEMGEGVVLKASDADVAIIAHHAARLAADTVLGAASYPNSMYLIGLAEAWVFEAPFATIPLAMSHLRRREQDAAQNAESASEADEDHVKFIISLVEKHRAANSSA